VKFILSRPLNLGNKSLSKSYGFFSCPLFCAMARNWLLIGMIFLTACSPTQSSRELNDRARASDRFGPPHTYSTPPSEMLDVEEKRRQQAIILEREENLRRRRQDLNNRY